MWKVGGVEIRVNEYGKFVAVVNGKEVSRTSLSAMKRVIEKGLDAVPVLVPDCGYSRWSVRKDEILRVVGHDRLKGKTRRESYRPFEPVYLYDEEALEKLKALIEEHDALRKRWDEVLETMTRITASNLDQFRQKKGRDGSGDNIVYPG